MTRVYLILTRKASQFDAILFYQYMYKESESGFPMWSAVFVVVVVCCRSQIQHRFLDASILLIECIHIYIYIMYSVHCTRILKIYKYNVYIVHCTLYNEYYTVYNLPCTLYTA